MLSKDFKEFIELLNSCNVRYLLVGGYAVALHGHPRYTKDLDIWLELSPENANAILATLEKFGFGSLGLSTSDFQKKEQIIQLGYPPNRIDLLTSLSGVDFETCYRNRQDIDINGLSIPLIDLESLKINKKASGRAQDLADVENLS